MMERIRLNGGHQQLSIAGFTYTPDESGAFEVPSDQAAELIRIHGGEVDPGVERLDTRVETIEAEIGAAKNFVVMKTEELKEAISQRDAYKRKQAEASATRLTAANTALNAVKPQQNVNNGQGQRK